MQTSSPFQFQTDSVKCEYKILIVLEFCMLYLKT